MKKIIYAILILVLSFAGGHFVYKAAKVKNVFDEMYFAEVQPVSKMYTSTSFQNLVSAQVLENLPHTVRENYLPNLYQEAYKSDALKNNEGISVFFDKNEETVTFIGTLDYSKDPAGEKFEGFRFAYLYRVNSKQLIIREIELVIASNELEHQDSETNDPEEIAKFMEKHNISEEDLIKYEDYFLYDKVLTDWFAHNPKSRFSLDDLGNVEILREQQ